MFHFYSFTCNNLYTLMKKEKKTNRHNFAFSDKTDALLRKITQETDIPMTTIIERGIELFAEKKGVSNG